MVLIVLILLPLGILWGVQRQFRLMPVVTGLLRRHKQAATAIVLLIGLATAVTVVFTVQEKALKSGSAQAADKFDLIVAAPGSQVDGLLATVYLQPTALPLLPASVGAELRGQADVLFAAPVGFGDHAQGYPLVGTTGDLVSHLTNTVETAWFDRIDQALAGSETPFQIGDIIKAQHGHVSDDSHEHQDELRVVRRLPVTGTRWDHALIVPIEALWKMHGLGDFALNQQGGGDSSATESVLQQPGVPAYIVVARNTGALYSLRQQFNARDSMAFFPAETLSRLFSVLGSVADVVGVLTLLTQLLVGLAVLLSVFILMRSLSARFATLFALGAPASFRFCLIWTYAAVLIIAGTVLGLGLGWVGANGLASWLSHYTRVSVEPQLSLVNISLVALFLNAMLILACLPAWLVARQQHSYQDFS